MTTRLAGDTNDILLPPPPLLPPSPLVNIFNGFHLFDSNCTPIFIPATPDRPGE